MIVRVFDDNDWATYYCTLCNRPFKPLHEANEHARFCGKAVLAQPTPDDDDDTQVYKKPWVGLTASEILNMMPSAIPAEYDGPLMEFARAVETKLMEKSNG